MPYLFKRLAAAPTTTAFLKYFRHLSNDRGMPQQSAMPPRILDRRAWFSREMPTLQFRVRLNSRVRNSQLPCLGLCTAHSSASSTPDWLSPVFPHCLKTFSQRYLYCVCKEGRGWYGSFSGSIVACCCEFRSATMLPVFCWWHLVRLYQLALVHDRCFASVECHS